MNTQQNQFESTTLKDLAAFMKDNKDSIPAINDLNLNAGITHPEQQNNKQIPVKPKKPIEKVPVNSLLKMSIANKNITPEVAATLKKTYEGQPEQLNELLKQMHDQRLAHLMSQTYEQLDKSGNAVELKDKFAEGYNQKVRDKFKGIYKDNDPGTGKINMDKLVDYTKDNPSYDHNIVKMLRYNFQDNPVKFKQLVDAQPMEKLKSMKLKSLNDLEKDNQLPEFKAQSLQSFKHKYLEEMGIPHDLNTTN